MQRDIVQDGLRSPRPIHIDFDPSESLRKVG